MGKSRGRVCVWKKEKYKEKEQEIDCLSYSFFWYNCSFYHEMNALWVANTASSTHVSTSHLYR